MVSNIRTQWDWYLLRLKDAEEMLENSKDTFKLDLLGQAAQLKEDAKNLVKELETLPTSSKT